MGLTLVEKILASRTDAESVRPGDVLSLVPDLLALDEWQAARLLRSLRDAGTSGSTLAGRILVVCGQLRAGEKAAEVAVYRCLRELAGKFGIDRVTGLGRGGVLNVELIDQGRALPGQLAVACDPMIREIGAVAGLGMVAAEADLPGILDSGSITYTVPQSVRLEFVGSPGRWTSGRDLILSALARLGPDPLRNRAVEIGGACIDRLDVVERLAITAMASELDTPLFCVPDDKALAWLRARSAIPPRPILPDRDAVYQERLQVDVNGQEPMVGLPHSPFQGKRISELADIPLDQVIIGAASGGRVEDLRIVARLLKEHAVHPDLRLIVIPPTQKGYLHGLEEGLIATLVRSGAVVAAPTAALWEAEGSATLGAGERCLTTTCRNRQGWQGAMDSEIYLGSPAVAAASAVMGRVAHPDEVLRRKREAV